MAVTEAKQIFEAHSKSLLELLSENGVGLYLPPYQRHYGWSKDKVVKLLDDTLHGLKNLGDTPDSFTFLGTVITIEDRDKVGVEPIVKQEVPPKVLTVIDGQQRLSSLLLLLVCVHNLIRQRSWKVFGESPPAPEDTARHHLYAETITVLQTLGTAFYERKNLGDAPVYPRLIRAYDDQWARTQRNKRYNSPIANLVYNYAELADREGGQTPATRPTDFRPRPRLSAGDGEGDLLKRFGEMRTALTKLAQRKQIEDLENLLPLSVLCSKIDFQKALFNHELNAELCTWMGELTDEPEAELLSLVMFAAYVLNRIALTVVQGKNEDYAFTIFESLNTTGEPLTAFETFVPRVVKAENISDYKNSEAHGYIAAVQNYLDRFGVGDKLQNATRDLLVTFALAETGKKLSTRLSDQRVYMKDTFERHSCSREDRAEYLRHLRDTAAFVGATWDPIAPSPRQLVGLDTSAMTDTIKLCLAFLKDLNHTIAIAPLVRFYSVAVQAEDGDTRKLRIDEFEAAIKAITAFTVFWRATRRTTGNIDSQYRAVMAGDSLTGIGPLARQWATPTASKPEPIVNVEALKVELSARLTSSAKGYGGIPNLASFIANASELPLYTISKPLTRFLLLAAHHDTMGDAENPGLIKPGKVGLAPCFTADGWLDEIHFTIEHVAPQQTTSGWQTGFYESKDVVHRLGNLVLAPGDANSSLSSRPWSEKKVLYQALGAHTAEDARSILTDSGLTFNQTTGELAQLSHYLPHLGGLGERADDWDTDFMARRTEVLLRLAYARLNEWLGLAWSESSSDAVVRPVDEDVDNDEDDIEAMPSLD